MARAATEDLLMTHKFQLLDVSIGVPPVILPMFGFSDVTAPELTLEHREIKEGNFEYPRKVFQSAAVNNIVLSRGAQLQDTDFWTWANNYLEGKREKKNIMLVQSLDVDPNATEVSPDRFGFTLPSVVEFFRQTPGRAWVLRNCSPGRYKTAGDFSAKDAQISIHELELVYEFFIEFNMGGV